MSAGWELGVVVVHHGAWRPTRACLAAVAADPSPVRRRVVVVDNSAGAEDAAAAGAAEPVNGLVSGGPEATPVERLACPDNPGYGGGANRGVAHLAARHGRPAAGWVVLNHDAEIAPGFLGAAAGALAGEGRERRRGGEVGAAAGPIYLDRIGGRLWYAGGSLRRWSGTVRQSRDPAAARQARDVGFLPGTALAVATRAWDAVGGFDPGFFLYHEDLDLCLRLERAGWRLRFVPEMAAVHRLGAATGSATGSPFYLEQMAKTRLRPHRSRPYRLYLAALHSLYVPLRAAALVAREGRGGVEKARALLRGHRAALRRG